jgi:hypothetical protein
MISDSEKLGVKKFLEKYEKYWNFQDSENFEGSIEEISIDACSKLGIPLEKSDLVKDYIRELYKISDGEGLSFILSPGPTFIYNQPDQVQRLQY